MNKVNPATRWPLALVLLTSFVTFITLVAPQSGVQSAVALVWMTFCPGVALVRRVVGPDRLTVTVVGAAMSLGLAQFLATVTMYLRVYSWSVVLSILVLITFGGAAADLRAGMRSSR
jgi:hypothetical protein